MKKIKIALIGAGKIGGMLALLAAQKKLGDIVLFDVFEGAAKGKAMDLNQMAGLTDSWCQIAGNCNFQVIKDADICIVSAGYARKPGMSTTYLLEKNFPVIEQVAIGINRYAPKSFIIVITNPVDTMVYALAKIGKFSRKKVVGMAGVLDSARFQTFLSLELGISKQDIHACVIGGHGDDMVPLFRFSTVGGLSLITLVKMGIFDINKLHKAVARTRNGGAEIIKYFGNGSAFYAPALAAIEMAESYLYNKRRIMPCSCGLEGEYGINDLFVGVPAIIGENGIEQIIEYPLTLVERKAFIQSVRSVKIMVKLMKKMKTNNR